jgi:putative ABC transport system permease protein
MLRHYLILSLKVLQRRKFFTFISIFGISFTLLVLMVVTAFFDHALAPMAPETRQARTLEASYAVMFGERSEWCCSPGFELLDRYARNLPGAEDVSLFSDDQAVNSYVDGRRLTSQMKRTDAAFWRILEFTFLEGRPYTDAELQDGSMVAVINRTTRERIFAGAAAEGRTLEADGQRFRVVGVVEDVSALRDTPYADIWSPYTTFKTDEYRRGLMGGFRAIVLAADASMLDDIRAEFNARLARIDRAELPGPQWETIVAPLEGKFDALARGASPFADDRSPEPQGAAMIGFLALIATIFVLLPTVNLVNINVSRIMERSSEIGIRKAFGASSRTLVGQFVVENIMLTITGGLVGFALSAIVLRAMNQSGMATAANGMPGSLGLNVRVFIIGLLLAVAFGIISGVYPAWRMSRLHPVEALRGGGR